jgi:hypothetical protein
VGRSHWPCPSTSLSPEQDKQWNALSHTVFLITNEPTNESAIGDNTNVDEVTIFWNCLEPYIKFHISYVKLLTNLWYWFSFSVVENQSTNYLIFVNIHLFDFNSQFKINISDYPHLPKFNSSKTAIIVECDSSVWGIRNGQSTVIKMWSPSKNNNN